MRVLLIILLLLPFGLTAQSKLLKVTSGGYQPNGEPNAINIEPDVNFIKIDYEDDEIILFKATEEVKFHLLSIEKISPKNIGLDPSYPDFLRYKTLNEEGDVYYIDCVFIVQDMVMFISIHTSTGTIYFFVKEP